MLLTVLQTFSESCLPWCCICMQLSHPLGSRGFAVRLNEKQSYNCNSDYKLLEKRLFVIGFGQRASKGRAKQQCKQMHRRRQKRDGKKETAGGSGQAGGTAGAMATAVSSGDDLTDFQSQPRSGQRLVSPAGGSGGRRSCSSVRVEFALWSLLLLRCAALPWPLCSRYLYLFLFYFYIYTVVHVCLSHCLTVCLPSLSLPLSLSLSVCLQHQLLPAEAASQRSRQPLRGAWHVVDAQGAQGVTSAMHFLAELK